MKKFATKISIKARPEAIWSVLTDAAGYVRWNSTVDKVDGEIAFGKKITVHTKASPGRAFPLTVAEFRPAQRMVWKGGMPLGLFTGTRTYTLTPTQDGTTEFAMVEEFAGLMAPLITRSIPDLQPAFDAFAIDLKKRIEG
ncbi:MAG: SRPBCC domain-containing protein [Alphaproteobacteria bacterium]|nr:SRPBCC domain-containing protein [Alphaproteobacteria bacterium]